MKQSKLCFLRIMLNFIELITLYEQVYLFLIYQYREIEMIMIIHHADAYAKFNELACQNIQTILWGTGNKAYKSNINNDIPVLMVVC